jgi:hypothetical protein
MLTTRPANPRKEFVLDIVEYIQKKHLEGHSIIISLDANESMHKKASGVARMTQLCGLEDVHRHFFPDQELPSHRKGKEKIDFMLVTPDILPSISAVGILEHDAGLTSDHRTMFLDLDISQFFRGLSCDPVSVKTRSFTTSNYKRMMIIRKHVQLEWERRKLDIRILKITQKKVPWETIRKDRLLSMWEKLDKEVG